ncbi:MAG: dihydropteroate synthase [Bacteroidota bacterium]
MNTKIMGILNVTPDSFSDGGKYFDRSLAVTHALEMLDQGADIIDIGGETTKPGSEPVPAEEELNRVVPVLEELLSKRPDAVVSVDTTKKQVAGEVLKRGAKIINDISALTFEPGMAEVIREYNASVVLMHIKGTPRDMQNKPFYENTIQEISDFLSDRINFARSNGIEGIIVDPGIGFGKRISDNFEILSDLQKFRKLGYPVLIGLSRKSFLGKTLNIDVSSRDTATAVAEAFCMWNGADIIRTHNVANAVQTVKLLDHLENPLKE